MFPKIRRIELVHLDIEDQAMQVHRDEINAKFPFGSNHPWPQVPAIVLDPGPGVPLCWQAEMAQWRLSPDTPTANTNFTASCDRCFAKHSCTGVMRGYAACYGADVVTPYLLDEYRPTPGRQGVRAPDPTDGMPASGEPSDPGDAGPFEKQQGVTYECAALGETAASLASVRLRIGHECNRRCNFCFIPHHDKSVQDYDTELIVRYSDAAPFLMETLDYCIEHGILVDGPSLKCGMPHCIVRGEPKYILDAVPIPEENRSDDWMRVPACAECTLVDQCYGVRRLYAWLYGIEEFKPVLEPGKLAHNFESQKAPIPVASIVRHSRNKAGGERAQAAESIERVRALLKLDGAALARELRAVEEFNFPLGDGLAQGVRVRFGAAAHPSLGSLEFGEDVSLVSCREGALLRTIRCAALGLPLRGAHGGIVLNAAALDNAGMERDGLPEKDLEALVAEYFTSLSELLPAGSRDYLTPHTSAQWSLVEKVDQRRTGQTEQVALLRRTPEGALEGMRMTSVDSAVASARCALRRQSSENPIVRYCIWGYGRAGQRFAELFDSVQIGGGKSTRRPMLVGCADSEHSWVDSRGLEHERISAFKTRNGVLPVGTASPPDAVLYEPCDLLVLGGRGAAFDAQTAARVGAKVVIDLTGAIDVETESALEKAGACFIPALIATSGPLVVSELERNGLRGENVATIRTAISTHVERLLDQVWSLRGLHSLSMLEAVIGVGLTKWLEPTHGDETSASI